MNISIIAFSLTGLNLAEELKEKLSEQNIVKVYAKGKSIGTSITESLNQWAEERFADSDAIVFVSSCGIAVRAIAPFVRSKKSDPAVIAVDELGIHAIALLSGHMGGANPLTLEVAKAVGAEPVITTATDIHGKMAPDVFAKNNSLVITDFTKAKEYAALQIQNRECEMEILVSPVKDEKTEKDNTLWLIPKWAYVGIGCRRNTEASSIHNVFYRALSTCGIDRQSIRGCASVTLKAEETGLLEFCRRENFDIRFFTPEHLKAVQGEFTESEFVKETVGVGNVCERSAMALAMENTSGGDGLQPYFKLRKFAEDGVTIAIVIKEEELRYE